MSQLPPEIRPIYSSSQIMSGQFLFWKPLGLQSIFISASEGEFNLLEDRRMRMFLIKQEFHITVSNRQKLRKLKTPAPKSFYKNSAADQ